MRLNYLILFIILISIFSFKSPCNRQVLLYALPFDNDYYSSINFSAIRNHKEVKIYKINKKQFVHGLEKIISSLDSNMVLKEYKSIDIRLLVQFQTNMNSNEIAFSRTGKFMFNGKARAFCRLCGP